MPNSENCNRDPKLDRIVKRLEEQEKMAAAWLYGSRARGNHRPESDYDIAIALNNFDQSYAERRLAPELLSMDLSAELEHHHTRHVSSLETGACNWRQKLNSPPHSNPTPHTPGAPGT